MAKNSSVPVFSAFQKKLLNYLKAGYPYLLVETFEEQRAVNEIMAVIIYLNSSVQKNDSGYCRYIWDRANGLTMLVADADGKPVVQADSQLPDSAMAALMDHGLGHIGKSKDDNHVNAMLVILKDFHYHFDDAARLRLLRNLIPGMKASQQTVIFISPEVELPVDLRKEVQRIEFALPQAKDLGRLFSEFATRYADKLTNKPDDNYVASVAEAAAGMTIIEAEDAMAVSFIAMDNGSGKLELGQDYTRNVFEEKILSMRNNFLQYVRTSAGFETVGGMVNVKRWAMKRRIGFDQPARDLSLPYPKGVLIGGPKGTGKSTVAKAIAAAWGFPLYLLDLGRLFGSKVGESEQNTRHLLRLFGSMGRAVILVDEIDRYLSTNSTSGAGDSGVSARMFGALLTWLAEKTDPVFLIGTLNNIEAMPPELIRRGRFDEVFFVDLPNSQERVAIFNALLRFKFKHLARINETREFRDIVDGSKDFSGAEIEAAICETLYEMLLINASPTDANQFLSALAKTVVGMKPQASMELAQINKMRERAKHGFVLANDAEIESSQVNGKEMITRNLKLN